MVDKAPAPDWIQRESDERPSDAMPSAGHADWREEAEWWHRTCEYWHQRTIELEDFNKRLTRDLELEQQEVARLVSEHELAPPDNVRGNQIDIDVEMKKQPEDRAPGTFEKLLDEAFKFGTSQEDS